MLSRPVSTTSAELVGRHLWAISQPVRVRLIDTLERVGEASVGELATTVGISRHDASQHLAILRRAGLVRRRRSGRHGLYQLIAPKRVFAVYEQIAADLHERVLGDACEKEDELL